MGYRTPKVVSMVLERMQMSGFHQKRILTVTTDYSIFIRSAWGHLGSKSVEDS